MPNFYVPANHRHFCQCGTELLCVSEPDHCPVMSEGWRCPACEQDDYDAYMEIIERFNNLTNPNDKEPN